MEDYEEPEEIETSIECPACGSKLFFINHETEIPHEGKINIQTYLCHKCLYKKSSIYRDSTEMPRKLTIRVERPEDLNVMIYRSPEALLKVPEIEAEIFPGEISEGELTTVEGILQRILDKIPLMREEDVDTSGIESFLERAIRAEEPVTIAIEDRTGKSRIESAKAREEKLS